MTISSRIAWVSAFFLAIALFYAPLAYGCTRPEMLPTLYLLLGGCIATGFLSMLFAWRRPAIPKTVLVCSAAVLAQGWYLAFHPVLPELVSENGWEVTLKMETLRRLSFASMELTTFILLAFIVTCNLFSDGNRRRFLLLAAAGAGALIAVIGVTMKLVGDPLTLLVWKQYEGDWNVFAFYRYHGNAGAFLNLGWPLILVFARRSYSSGRGSMVARIFWTICAVACGCALFLNASKASLAIGLLILPWPFVTGLKRMNHKMVFTVVALALLVIAGALFASSQFAKEAAFQRMTNSTEVSASFHGRVSAYHQFMITTPEVGAWGFGPGLFQVAFPYQQSPLGNTAVGLREYAHEDYLQTALEWGWFGTLCWTLIVFGGIVRGFRTYAQRERFPSKTDRHLVLGALLGVLGTLAQASIDFPLQVPSIRLPFLVLLAFCWASPMLLVAVERDARMRRYRLPVPSEYAKKMKAYEEKA